jgi:ribose/xylose/arabinose/galactoside ABC-type transport system permease subunit
MPHKNMAGITERREFSITTNRVKRILKHDDVVRAFILLIIVVVLAIVTKGLTTTRGNIANIWSQSAMRGVSSVGQLFVILTGGIDLAVGGVALATAVLGASLMTERLATNILGYPAPMSMALPIMIFFGLGIGTANGMAISRIHMPALIVTLAMWQIMRGTAYQIGEGWTILELPSGFAFFGHGDIAGVPVPVIIFLSVAVVAHFVLNYTTFGRSVYAVGGNPLSAWLSGIRVNNIICAVYIISGFLAAVAGILALSRGMAASMVTAQGLELDAIASVCIGGVSLAGGRGTLIGSVIGVLIIGVINNGMNVYGLDPAFQDLIKGAIIFAAVAFDYLRKR